LISTLSVFSIQPPAGTPQAEVLEVPLSADLHGGYPQTKWVAEQLAVAAGASAVDDPLWGWMLMIECRQLRAACRSTSTAQVASRVPPLAAK
jgi:hypothetical protein